jgi:exodeoxyribonuclease-3
MVKLATWNVNSIRARLDRAVAWLDANRPDVVCMQELKVENDGFPREPFEAAGYQLALYGQKTYNGVAILSRAPMTDITTGMDDGDPDDHARLIAATIDGVRVISAYFPNGGELNSDKYEYKLKWIARLRAWLGKRDASAPLILAGDFNVAPEDRDVHDPVAWAGQTLFSEPEKAALREVAAWGLHDTFRKHSAAAEFTWWDYRGIAFLKNHGLRIDHVWATTPAYEVCTSCVIDRESRKGKNASDHAPVIAQFAF